MIFAQALVSNSDVFFSGLIGVMVGGSWSLFLQNRKEFRESRSKLGTLLFKLSAELEYAVEKDVYIIFDEHLPQIWIGARDLAALLYLRHGKAKKVIQVAALLCGDLRIINNDPSLRAGERSLPSHQNAKKYTDELLRIIGYE